MHRLRLHFILALTVALWACAGWAQDSNKSLDDQLQNKFDTKDQDSNKPKKHDKAKNDDGHRKHWYSMPHFRHKKHDKDAAAQRANANSKNVPAKPVNQPVATRTGSPKSAAFMDSGKDTKAKPKQKSEAMATRKPVHKNMSGKGQVTKAAATAGPHKTVAKNSHAKKPVQRSCTPEESKKGGCRASHQQVARAAHAS